LKIQTAETCSSSSSISRNFYLKKKTKISIFGGISKFCLCAVLGGFGQFWAEIAALTVAESLPKVWLKILKPHNS
jgi:hypothetical protein